MVLQNCQIESMIFFSFKPRGSWITMYATFVVGIAFASYIPIKHNYHEKRAFFPCTRMCASNVEKTTHFYRRERLSRLLFMRFPKNEKLLCIYAYRSLGSACRLHNKNLSLWRKFLSGQVGTCKNVLSFYSPPTPRPVYSMRLSKM